MNEFWCHFCSQPKYKNEIERRRSSRRDPDDDVISARKSTKKDDRCEISSVARPRSFSICLARNPSSWRVLLQYCYSHWIKTSERKPRIKDTWPTPCDARALRGSQGIAGDRRGSRRGSPKGSSPMNRGSSGDDPRADLDINRPLFLPEDRSEALAPSKKFCLKFFETFLKSNLQICKFSKEFQKGVRMHFWMDDDVKSIRKRRNALSESAHANLLSRSLSAISPSPGLAWDELLSSV